MVMAKTLDLETLNQKFENAEPQEILRWAIEEFRSKIAFSSSFQTESVVLLHMVSQIDPEIPVLFLETGWHFPETLEFKREVVKLFRLTNVIDLKSDSKK